MALREHLRPDQDIHIVRLNLFSHVPPRAPAARAVPIDSEDARIWKSLLQDTFDALCSATDGMKV